MDLLARGKGKIPNRAVSLSTPTTAPALPPHRARPLASLGLPLKEVGPQMNWSHLWPEALVSWGGRTRGTVTSHVGYSHVSGCPPRYNMQDEVCEGGVVREAAAG